MFSAVKCLWRSKNIIVQKIVESDNLLPWTFVLCNQGNSLQRALNVAAFAVSGYASCEGRHCKPFNPLLGETYEADFPEKGIRFFSEKVLCLSI
jgi:hypothetical protein